MDENHELNNGAPQENPQAQEPTNTQQQQPSQMPYGGYYYTGGQYQSNRSGGSYSRPQDNYQWNLNQYGAPIPPKPSKGKGGRIAAIVICCVLAISGVVGFGVWSAMRLPAAGAPSDVSSRETSDNISAAEKTPDLVIQNKPENSAGVISAEGELTGEMIYEKVSPSVVGIVVYSSETTATKSGEGSGIILSSDGYIVTNEHVVEGAKLIEVVLSNEERYTAKLIGYDMQTDLAVVKIDAQNLVAAQLGNSDELKPGEKVYAIGNPGGMEFANSITDGIVGGVNRLLTNSSTGYVMTCIQTNAAINPGNSGGALVDRYGRVVGINVAKIADTDYEGMGFAIPISRSTDLISDLMEYGYIKGRPKLGITYSLISSAVSQFYGVPAGIRVDALDPECDAYKKGLKTGDIITSIDGESLNSASDVMQIMASHKAGDTIKLKVYRQGMTGELTVTLSENDGRDTSNYIKTDGSSDTDNTQSQESDSGWYGGNFPFGDYFRR